MSSRYERDVEALLRGVVRVCGRFTLPDDGVTTQTVVRRQSVQRNSIIIPVATNAGAGSDDGRVWIEAGNDQFTVHHPASTQARSYSYVFFAPNDW